MERRARPRVLLDTNILISGLLFESGNEHRILSIVERGEVKLVLPEPVLVETREILTEKFPGFEILLDIFLEKLDFETASLREISPRISADLPTVRDKKDAPIYSSAAVSKPDYVVSGDTTLRSDPKSPEILSAGTKICTSREFLRLIEN